MSYFCENHKRDSETGWRQNVKERSVGKPRNDACENMRNQTRVFTEEISNGRGRLILERLILYSLVVCSFARHETSFAERTSGPNVDTKQQNPVGTAHKVHYSTPFHHSAICNHKHTQNHISLTTYLSLKSLLKRKTERSFDFELPSLLIDSISLSCYGSVRIRKNKSSQFSRSITVLSKRKRSIY